jgi:hypothetical protein
LTYGLAVLAVGAYSIPLLLIGWLSIRGFQRDGASLSHGRLGK